MHEALRRRLARELDMLELHPNTLREPRALIADFRKLRSRRPEMTGLDVFRQCRVYSGLSADGWLAELTHKKTDRKEWLSINQSIVECCSGQFALTAESQETSHRDCP